MDVVGGNIGEWARYELQHKRSMHFTSSNVRTLLNWRTSLLG